MFKRFLLMRYSKIWKSFCKQSFLGFHSKVNFWPQFSSVAQCYNRKPGRNSGHLTQVHQAIIVKQWSPREGGHLHSRAEWDVLLSVRKKILEYFF